MPRRRKAATATRTIFFMFPTAPPATQNIGKLTAVHDSDWPLRPRRRPVAWSRLVLAQQAAQQSPLDNRANSHRIMANRDYTGRAKKRKMRPILGQFEAALKGHGFRRAVSFPFSLRF